MPNLIFNKGYEGQNYERTFIQTGKNIKNWLFASNDK